MKIPSRLSVILSLILSGVSGGAILFFAVSLPFGEFAVTKFVLQNINAVPVFYVVCYILAAVGLTAITLLFRLLLNIRDGVVFKETNVKLLRALSWCCIAAAVVIPFLIMTGMTMAPVLCSLVALFVGVLLRVVKNAFEEATRIKEENDLTV